MCRLKFAEEYPAALGTWLMMAMPSTGVLLLVCLLLRLLLLTKHFNMGSTFTVCAECSSFAAFK
jgi:hypothetical protein